ncbi:MAG: sigma-70 family RNA polymerase sigma factor [Planctomycetota bacterium]
MALAAIDRRLIERCLSGKPQAWQDFVDRYMGLFIHVVTHTAKNRSIRLAPADTEDLVSEVMMTVIADDFAVLRRFRQQSSLPTYLTVIARRVVVRQLIEKLPPSVSGEDAGEPADGEPPPEQRIGNQEEVERLLSRLDGPEAAVVRMYHLEGKSYSEISEQTGMPAGSVGPTLYRARQRMRQGSRPAG